MCRFPCAINIREFKKFIEKHGRNSLMLCNDSYYDRIFMRIAIPGHEGGFSPTKVTEFDNKKPCIFFKDGLCMIYEDRPMDAKKAYHKATDEYTKYFYKLVEEWESEKGIKLINQWMRREI